MRIAIVGLGLIGGSLGLALKQSRWRNAVIVGYARRHSVASAALEHGVVDSVEYDLHKTVLGANIVIVATPVLAIREILFRIAPLLQPGTIVTDTGSTKLQVMQWAKEILGARVNFIGGHPMAGKESSGVEAATAELFQKCVYCLIPSDEAAPEAVHLVREMVVAIGAAPLLIDAKEHDNLVAGISHLPMLMSVALVLATTKSPGWEQMSKLAASGYQDITRLASGNVEMHTHICLTNREPIVSWIDKLIAELQKLRETVLEGKAEQIENILASAKWARENWLKARISEK